LSDCGCVECFERPDLRMAGITWSTMFPDLDGLTVDLRSWF